MNLFRVFSIGADRILGKGCCVKGTVTHVGKSYLHVVKKPVRLYPNETNTLYSHFIIFEYSVDNISYKGKLYVDLRYRCPQKWEKIDVYYDPADPRQYACYAFGPAAKPIGW